MYFAFREIAAAYPVPVWLCACVVCTPDPFEMRTTMIIYNYYSPSAA